jgi:hypothetical protein
MAYRIILPLVLFISLSLGLITGCSDQQTKNNSTYYVELMGFTNDSLKNLVSEMIMGKVSYYKGNKLEILSENYVTPDFPELHYFRNAGSLGKDIDKGTLKIRVQFSGAYSKDSIHYLLQKFTYKDDKWVKTSDMGLMKVIATAKTNRYAMLEFGNEIVNNIVTYTYN